LTILICINTARLRSSIPPLSLHCPLPHRPLLSFPTRRSSDLTQHDPALHLRAEPLSPGPRVERFEVARGGGPVAVVDPGVSRQVDRKSIRLNSSHLVISYAVFCLKKKKTEIACCLVVWWPPVV